MARYGRDYGGPGWVDTIRRGWGYGVGNGYDAGLRWGGRYDRDFPRRGGSTARGGGGRYESLYGTGNRTGYNRYPRGYMGRGRYDRGW